jgi:hypothetical protein
MKEKVIICGREITQEDIETAIFIVDNFGGFSRKELTSKDIILKNMQNHIVQT